MKFTPNDLEVLIHCHVCPAPHPRREAPAVINAIAILIGQGLITIHEPNLAIGNIYTTTEKGRAHVMQLCSLPLPTQQWVDYKGDIV